MSRIDRGWRRANWLERLMMAFSGILLVAFALAPYLPAWRPYIGTAVFFGLVAGLICWPVVLYVRWRQVVREASKFRCRKSEYPFGGLTEPRCPECGESFDMKLLNTRKSNDDQ